MGIETNVNAGRGEPGRARGFRRTYNDEFSKAPLLQPAAVRSGIIVLVTEISPKSFRKHWTNTPPFFPAPRRPSLFFARAFLLVNPLTSRRHFTVKALTGSLASWCTRKSVSLGKISIFPSPICQRKCATEHLRGPICSSTQPFVTALASPCNLLL